QVGTFLNNSMRVVCGVTQSLSSGAFGQVVYTMEGFDWREIAHKPTTVAFWVNSNVTGTYCLSLRNSGLDRAYVSEFSISSVSTWERKLFTIPEAPTTGTWDYSNGAGLRIGIALAAGTNLQTTNNNWTATTAIATANQVNFMNSAGNTLLMTSF